MNKYLILAGMAIVAGAATTSFIINKHIPLPLPPELEKERQEAEEIYAAYRKENPQYNNNLASQSSSDCQECLWAVNNLNNVANMRNSLIQETEKLHNSMLDLSDKLRLVVLEERNEWDRVTDLPQYDVPEKTFFQKISSFFGGSNKIYDVVLPEDVELINNPNKIEIKEEDLGHYRELQKKHKDITDKIVEHEAVYVKLEAARKEIEDSYAKAIADFNTCTGSESCKKKQENTKNSEINNVEEKFSTSILDIRPIEEFGKDGIFEYTPNIYNKQKLGKNDYAQRTKFKIVKNVNCGKTENIAWWQGQEKNAMGIRWYRYECSDAGLTPTAHFVVEMYFDDKKFAECEYNFPGGSKACARFD